MSWPATQPRTLTSPVRPAQPSPIPAIAVRLDLPMRASHSIVTISHSHRSGRRINANKLSVNAQITVRLKWSGTEYTGNLVSVDSYMNIQLSDTEEWQAGKNNGTLGQVLIRYVFRERDQTRPEC